MRLAILSDVTADFFARDFVRAGNDVYLPAGFNVWMQEVFDDKSGLHSFNPDVILVLLDGGKTAAADEAIERLKLDFSSALVFAPDMATLAAETPGFYDERMRALAAMPFSLSAMASIKEELEFARMARQMKVLALDADNTLWRGVVSDDGVRELLPFAEFQRGVRELKDRGVILALLSKNDMEDVRAAMSRMDMILKEEDFSGFGVNGGAKNINLTVVCRELNLSPDSVVFVDDNPIERAGMRAALPDVVVPPFPADMDKPKQFLRRINEYFFSAAGKTEESARRSSFYHDAIERKKAAAAAQSLDSFLAGLRSEASVFVPGEEDIPRMAELSSRTNQFNANGHRIDAARFCALIADDCHRVWAFRARDRFGDFGIVGYAVAELCGESARITDFAMSCRVMERTLEHFVLNEITSRLAEEGVTVKGVDYLPTAKNAPFKRFIDASPVYAAPFKTFFTRCD